MTIYYIEEQTWTDADDWHEYHREVIAFSENKEELEEKAKKLNDKEKENRDLYKEAEKFLNENECYLIEGIPQKYHPYIMDQTFDEDGDVYALQLEYCYVYSSYHVREVKDIEI